MKRMIVSAIVLTAIITLCPAATDRANAAEPPKVKPKHTANILQKRIATERSELMPLAFSENQGQWDEKVEFRVDAGGATIWFTTDGIYYQFTRLVSKGSDVRHLENPPHERQMSTFASSDSIEQIVIKASFVGANPDVEIIGEGLMDYRCNYFIGNDPAKWYTDVPNYKSVTLQNIYDGIDVRFGGNESGNLTYTYLISPEADRNRVKVDYEGLAEFSHIDDGTVTVDAKWGTISGIISSPRPDEDEADDRFLSTCPLHSSETGNLPLATSSTQSVALIFSTYLGGNWTDRGMGIAVDNSGEVYVTGYTYSTDFPTEDPYQTDLDNFDAFVTKLSSDGSSLVFSTYLGGNDEDKCYCITVDGSGSLYFAGCTWSDDFPLLNPIQTLQGYNDAFVAKLSSSGSSLEYSTYLGGSWGEVCYAISVNGSGEAFVTGETASPDFPTVNPFQASPQGYDEVFIAKLSNSGSSLLYSTYVGGYYYDYGYGIAVDNSGSAYVTGYTFSTDFPTVNPFMTDQPGWDAFVIKLSSTGNSLEYSTYLGGEGHDRAFGIAVDDLGIAYVTGETASPDFPMVDAFQETYNGFFDAFVTKLSVSGSSLLYSTFLGGSGEEEGEAITIDEAGAIYLTGFSESEDFPISASYQEAPAGLKDGFVTKLSPSGGSLDFSTYLGGNGQDISYAIAVDSSGAVYVTGLTSSTDFPTANPIQATHHGDNDAFVAKLAVVLYTCGDADGSGAVDIDDVVYLIAYIFSGGPEPLPYQSGDAECSGAVDIDDVVYLINYIFTGGYAPCETDGDGEPDC